MKIFVVLYGCILVPRQISKFFQFFVYLNFENYKVTMLTRVQSIRHLNIFSSKECGVEMFDIIFTIHVVRIQSNSNKQVEIHFLKKVCGGIIIRTRLFYEQNSRGDERRRNSIVGGASNQNNKLHQIHNFCENIEIT